MPTKGRESPAHCANCNTPLQGDLCHQCKFGLTGARYIAMSDLTPLPLLKRSLLLKVFGINIYFPVVTFDS